MQGYGTYREESRKPRTGMSWDLQQGRANLFCIAEDTYNRDKASLK